MKGNMQQTRSLSESVPTTPVATRARNRDYDKTTSPTNRRAPSNIIYNMF